MQLVTDPPEAVQVTRETLRPLGNYVLVKRAKPAEKSAGGVIVPDTVQREQKKTNPIAYVIAVGAGLPMDDGRRYPIDVKPGDKVQLLRTLAEAVLEGVEEETLWLVDVGQILGVVEPESVLG